MLKSKDIQNNTNNLETDLFRSLGSSYFYGPSDFSVSGHDQLKTSSTQVTMPNKLRIGLDAVSGFTATAAAGGTVPNGTYYYKIFSFNANDRPGIWSPEEAVVLAGANGTVNLSWTAVEGAAYYRVGKGTAQGAITTYIQTTAISLIDSGQAFTAGNPVGSGQHEGAIVCSGTIDIPSNTGALRWYRFTTGVIGGSVSMTSAGEMDFWCSGGGSAGNYIFLSPTEDQQIMFQTSPSSAVITFATGATHSGTIEADPLIFSIGGGERVRFTSTAVTINPTSNQLILGSTRTVTLNAPTPATSSRTWTIPDISADGTFAALEGAQTFTGSKIFNGGLESDVGSGIQNGITFKDTTNTQAGYIIMNGGAGTCQVILSANRGAAGNLQTGQAAARVRLNANNGDGNIDFLTTAANNAAAGTRFTIDKNGNVAIGTAALATNATDGFFYLDSCAGTPTGTPTTFTGRIPAIYDTTNDRFYVYNGSWKSVVLA